MSGYDPEAIRRRLMERRELVAGNLQGWRVQVERSHMPPTAMLLEAVAGARQELDELDRELGRDRVPA